MSNRNFDSRVIIQRIQNQNYARNLYQTNINGQTLISNPQNSDGTSSRFTTFVPGAKTDYFRGLIGAGETVSVGGTFGVSAITTAPPSPPSPPPSPPPSLPAPTSLSGVGGDQAIYVLFTQSGNGGSPIINYEYSINDGPFVPFSPAQTFSPVAITTIDGETSLTNSTSYTVTLKAVNAIESSLASASTSVVTTVNTLNTTNLLVELDANNASSYSGSGEEWTNLRSSGTYSATLQNTPLFNNANKYFTFNGTNQIAQIAAAAAINPTPGSSFTIQIWARVDTSSPAFNSGDGLISKQFGSSSDYDGYSLTLNSSGGLSLNMNGSSVNGNYASSTGVYGNEWALYTIVVRFGGRSGNPSYAYVSTRRVVTAANAESGMPSQAPLQFPRGFQDGYFCPADVGAFYLYDRAVSQEDIIRNYDATKARYV
jgi:hypothetical protein